MKRQDWLMMAAGIAAVAGALPGAVADELTLTRDGAPAAAIVLAEKPTKAAQFAAHELQWHVKAISGATLPIQTESAAVPDGHVRLMVGDGTDAKALGLTPDSFGLQEHVVRFES
ncbi:MAG: hypothetical protein PHR35_04645, partial [Kiritimatiellae bacterium]|nr:hypothetical protein [Kiritimatiellia bacterium]